MKAFLAIFFSMVFSTGGLGYIDASVQSGQTSYRATQQETALMSTTVTIDYNSKEKTTFNMALVPPTFTFSPYAGACACIAGSNVLGYFDRYDEDLIPNHVSGREFAGSYIYQIDDSAVGTVVEQLYADMGTTSAGTTVNQFISGMQKYVARKGKSITFTSCMTSKKFDYSKAKSSMEANQPVVLFLSGYHVADIMEVENKDHIAYYDSSDSHVMVGFGYRDITYSTSSGTKEYNFLSVAACLTTYPAGWLDIDHYVGIDDAYAINIY